MALGKRNKPDSFTFDEIQIRLDTLKIKKMQNDIKIRTEEQELKNLFSMANAKKNRNVLPKMSTNPNKKN